MSELGAVLDECLIVLTPNWAKEHDIFRSFGCWRRCLRGALSEVTIDCRPAGTQCQALLLGGWVVLRPDYGTKVTLRFPQGHPKPIPASTCRRESRPIGSESGEEAIHKYLRRFYFM